MQLARCVGRTGAQRMIDCWILRVQGGGRIEFKGRAMERMRRHVQADPASLEAGGILIGRRIIDSNDIVVDAVTEPAPQDRRGRLRFHRLPQGHQQILDKAWVSSGGVAAYLGEWHTHASKRALPSAVDRANWRRLSRLSGEPLLFVILATSETGCWCAGQRCETYEG